MAYGMFPTRQTDSPFVAGGMFAEGHILRRAVGESQAECRLFVNGRRDRADIRVVAEDAQEMRLSIFSDIAIDPQANAGRHAWQDQGSRQGHPGHDAALEGLDDNGRLHAVA